MSNVVSATSSNLIPIGALFSAAWARLSRAWLGFGLLLLLAPLGILVASLFVAALAIGALGIIHGKDFALGLLNPFRFYTFASIAENRRILMILAVLAGFLSLRWLGVLWKAATHLSLTPELGFSKALREGNRDSSYFRVTLAV